MASKATSSSRTSAATPRKLKSLSLAQKLSIIEDYEKGVRRTELMTRYDVKPSTLHDILKGKEKVKETMKKMEDVQKGKEVFRSRKTEHKDLDDAVYKWYVQERAEGVPVRGVDIQHAADRLAGYMGIQNFRCSEGWLWRFRRRHGIVNRFTSGKVLSADTAAAGPFIKNRGAVLQEFAGAPLQHLCKGLESNSVTLEERQKHFELIKRRKLERRREEKWILEKEKAMEQLEVLNFAMEGTQDHQENDDIKVHLPTTEAKDINERHSKKSNDNKKTGTCQSLRSFRMSHGLQDNKMKCNLNPFPVVYIKEETVCDDIIRQ